MISPQKQINSRNIEQYLVGLTGSICSGKSKASEYFSEFGAYVIDCDKVVHELYKDNISLRYSLYKEFGFKIFNFKLEIDRGKLRGLVFSDDSKMKRLESIVWPYVEERAMQRLEGRKGIIILEAAMLYESGLNKRLDKNILVLADEEIRIKRLMKRNNINKNEVSRFIKAQKSDINKKQGADYIIDNNRSFDSFKRDIEVIWKFLNKDFSTKNNLSTGE